MTDLKRGVQEKRHPDCVYPEECLKLGMCIRPEDHDHPLACDANTCLGCARGLPLRGKTHYEAIEVGELPVMPCTARDSTVEFTKEDKDWIAENVAVGIIPTEHDERDLALIRAGIEKAAKIADDMDFGLGDLAKCIRALDEREILNSMKEKP